MSNQPKVLFLGHDASRTGAPLLLLEVIKWLRSNSAMDAAILLKKGGAIESEYAAIAPTRCYNQELEKMNAGLHRRILRKLKLSTKRIPDIVSLYPPEEFPVIYANTIATVDLVEKAIGRGYRIIHHIHELSYCTDLFGSTERLKAAVNGTDVYIAASGAVKSFLIDSIGVPEEKIQVIQEFPIAVGGGVQGGRGKNLLKERLNIPEDGFVIGMCGLPQWRKGTDLFVQLAREVKRHPEMSKCHFVWVGGAPMEALHDAKQLGLQNFCHFVPAIDNPEEYFCIFDLFALTSREDPFPVAMLEAAVAGVPIICFAGAGGAPELVESDAGVIVPYLDVASMARACVELWADHPRRTTLGIRAQAKVHQQYMLANQGPKILAIIEAALRNSGQANTSN